MFSIPLIVRSVCSSLAISPRYTFSSVPDDDNDDNDNDDDNDDDTSTNKGAYCFNQDLTTLKIR